MDAFFEGGGHNASQDLSKCLRIANRGKNDFLSLALALNSCQVNSTSDLIFRVENIVANFGYFQRPVQLWMVV